MSITKDEFFKYIGEENSLSGYSRSYKLVLYRILIEDIINQRISYVDEVAEKFKNFYLDRKNSGKIADINVDEKIANIGSSTIEQVTKVIMINPYKYIHENGYLNIIFDNRQSNYFTFDTTLTSTITETEWTILLEKVNKKIILYFSRIDSEEINAPQITSTVFQTNELIKVDFSDISKYCNDDYYPTVLVINNTIFRMSNWEELLKIYFYLVNNTSDGENYFETVCNNRNFSNLGYSISKNYAMLNNPCKFAKDKYICCLKTKEPQRLLDSYFYASRNLRFIKQVKDDLLVDFELWICKREHGEKIDNECNKLINTLSPKGKRNKIKVIKTKNFIAHMNYEILSDAEKFYLKLEKEYDKKVLLGDIIISDDEDKILKDYMKIELTRLDKKGMDFTPNREKVFAFGLVQYAMKYYSEGKFWPYFEDEYGVGVKGNNQKVVHDCFAEIMYKTGKTYDYSLPQKIDNISLHSFVTDKCSKQFFDYLFDFWRKELNRNIENMYQDNNIFKELISEIKSNNNVSIANVMKHTSMALALNEKSCKLRIRRFLKLIDECFWNDYKIPQTGNRFNELLREWMDIKGGKFKTELNIKIRQKGVRGQKLLSKPQLKVQFKTSTFALRLPQEILPHCTEKEYTMWKIEAEELDQIVVPCELMRGGAFFYTEEIEQDIPIEMLFKRITMTLYSEKRKFINFSISASNVRFFKNDGSYVDHSLSLPTGNLLCYSHIKKIPQILYKEEQSPHLIARDMYVGRYQVEKGDIMLFEDNHAVLVGDRIDEGINNKSQVDGVMALSDGVFYSVYSKLPKILFRANKEQIGGIAIIIGQNKPQQLIEHNYREFKIEDSIEEIFAYTIDLCDFIQNEGCYQVRINIPNSQKQHIYNLCYIDGFSFKYDNAPYILKETGALSFNKKFKIKMKSDAWEQIGDKNILNLNFNPKSAEFSNNYIKDWKVKLDYDLYDNPIELMFDIPIFLWKYKKDGEWSISKPADIFLKNLPNKLYVKGPFDFRDKDKNKLFLDLKNSNSEDTDIFAEIVKDEDYFAFSIENFKSWLNHDILMRQINLQLNGNAYSFFNVYCRSYVTSHNLTIGGLNATILYGDFKVKGDSEYTVSISRDNEVIVEDISLEDGKFEIEIDKTSGKYAITVYELFEDDSGFGSFNVKIGSYNIEVKDLKNLKQKEMYIKEIRDISGGYAPISLDQNYRIVNLTKTNFETLKNKDVDLCLWREDLSDSEKSELPMYKCDILNERNERISGLLVFYNSIDIKSATILELLSDSAVSLCYDSYRHRLISEKDTKKFPKGERFKRTKSLNDDIYSFIIE